MNMSKLNKDHVVFFFRPRWDDSKDIALIREVRMQQPYLERVGSKEAGIKWTEIANSLNAHPRFKDFSRDQRSVRERFNRLWSEFSAKIRKEENSSGTSPDDLTEVELVLEEIQTIIRNSMPNKSSQVKANERAKAMTIRDQAMKTWSKSTKSENDASNLDDRSDSEESSTSDSYTKPRSSRKRRKGNDALEYMQIRHSSDVEMKKEEIEIRKQQFEMEQKKLELEIKKQDQMQAYLLSQQKQAVIQQQQQQQQIQQQMQLQSQMVALLAKLSKSP